MEFPKDLKYTKEHEWVRLTGSTAEIGVTAFALEQLGDIVHVELPNAGESFAAGAAFGTIESTKTVSDLYIPISGKVTAVNNEAAESPEALQENPYQGWLVKVEIDGSPSDDQLLSHEAYEKFVAEQED
jgi:glycine cleavage system H protein